MSLLAVAIVTVLYAIAAIDEAMSGRPSVALMLVGYTVANLGLMWGMK